MLPGAHVLGLSHWGKDSTRSATKAEFGQICQRIVIHRQMLCLGMMEEAIWAGWSGKPQKISKTGDVRMERDWR